MILGPEHTARPIPPVRSELEPCPMVSRSHKRYSAEILRGRSISSQHHLRSPGEPIYRDESGISHDPAVRRTYSLRKAESLELENLESWNKWCAETESLYPTPIATPLGSEFAGAIDHTEAQRALFKDRRRQSWYNNSINYTLNHPTAEPPQFGSTHRRGTLVAEKSDESMNRGDYSSDLARRDDGRTNTPTELSLESECDRDAFPTPRHLRNISDFEFGKKAFNRLSTGSLQSCSGSEDAYMDVFGSRPCDFGYSHANSEAGPRKLVSERPQSRTPSQKPYRNHRRQVSRVSSPAEHLHYLGHGSRIDSLGHPSPLLSPPLDVAFSAESGKRSSMMHNHCAESPLSPPQQTNKVETWAHLQDVFGMLAQKEREVLEAKQNLVDAEESLKNFRLKLNSMLGTQPIPFGLCPRLIIMQPRIIPGIGINCLHYVRIVPEAVISPWQIEDDCESSDHNDNKSLGYIMISKLLYMMQCVLHTMPTYSMPFTVAWEPDYPSATMTIYQGLKLPKKH